MKIAKLTVVNKPRVTSEKDQRQQVVLLKVWLEATV